MYPYLRFARVVLAARRRPSLSLNDTSVLRMRVWPTDIDVFPEMNNGRHLTLMDLGRFDLAERAGLMRVVHANRWGLAVAGASVRFRHRLRPFRRFELRTRAVGRDERWFYFHQTLQSGGRTCSAALIRAGITRRSGLVSAAEVLAALGAADWSPALPDWVRAWGDADALRPWPPE